MRIEENKYATFKVHQQVMPYVAIVSFLLFIGFPTLQWKSLFALVIFFYQLLLLLFSMGKVVPIRYMFGTLMSLQMLVGPVVSYNLADQYLIESYRMKVPEDEYFLFTIPAVLTFIGGLHIFDKGLKGESLNIRSIVYLKLHKPGLPLRLIIIGFIGSFVYNMMPEELKFVFYLIGSLKFIGLFLLVLGSDKFPILLSMIVFGYQLILSFHYGVFHDLILWLIFFASIFLLRYKLSIKYRVLIGGVFFLFILIIQFAKLEFRDAVMTGAEANFETFGSILEETGESKGSMFSEENLSISSIRINQGYILTNIMKNVPVNMPFENGNTLRKIFFSALFPRFLFPEKLKAGDQEIFMKYTGMRLSQNTAMALGAIGDGYVNFGKTGSVVFMFFYGLIFNLVLQFFHRRSRMTPTILLFMPLIFIYPIRPDCELQTILGHLIKSSFLVVIIYHFFRKSLTYVTA